MTADSPARTEASYRAQVRELCAEWVTSPRCDSWSHDLDALEVTEDSGLFGRMLLSWADRDEGHEPADAGVAPSPEAHFWALTSSEKAA